MTSYDHDLISDFLIGYAEATAQGDSETIARSYAENYLETGPGGILPFHIDENYRKALREKSAFMASGLGLSSSRVAVDRVQEIAGGHFLVAATWTLGFARDRSEPKRSSFVMSYVVRIVDSSPKILLAISHEDEEEVMKRDGIIPR